MESWLTRITDYLLIQSWQIAVLTIAVALASFLLRNRSAHVRYLLWLVVLAKCLVPPLYSIPLAILPQEKSPALVPVPPPAEALAAEHRPPEAAVTEPVGPASVRTETVPSLGVMERPATYDIRAWLAVGWIAGVVVLSFYYLLNAVRTQIWLQRRRKTLPSESARSIESFFTAHGVSRMPRIWLVERISQPFVWGLVRGSIYLPAKLLDGRHAKFQASLLGHELSHVIRFDAMVNSLQVITQIIFWFHPFVWWANRKIRVEREKCCDEMTVARLRTSPEDYSEAVVETLAAKHEQVRPVPSLAVAGPVKNIEERINTMLRPGRKFYKRPSLVAGTLVLLIALVIVPTALVLTARAEKAGGALHKLSEPESSKSGDIVTCTGIVVDAKERPVAGARVRLYEVLSGDRADSPDTVSVAEETTTKADGAFRFSVSANTSGNTNGCIVVSREGMAIGWSDWGRMQEDIEVVIRLGEPKELSGVVVDENGNPIRGAQVTIWELMAGEYPNVRYLHSEIAEEMFSVQTDLTGKFSFSSLSGEHRANLLVNKAGGATIGTVAPEGRVTWRPAVAPGQKNIRIEMPVEARIEGIVVQKNTGKAVAGVQVVLMEQWPSWMAGSKEPIPWHKRVTSGEDGKFSVNAVAPGKYFLHMRRPESRPVEWVAEPVQVKTEAGQTTRDVRMEVSQGGVLEVTVADATTRRPLENAKVLLRGRYESVEGQSNANGIARIRVLPGQYSHLLVVKQGYISEDRREAVLIEEGQTEHVECRLKVQPKIRGVLKDAAGKPVDWDEVTIHVPAARVCTTTDGRFEFSWNPRSMMGLDKASYLIARDEKRNLVAVVKIDENTGNIDVTLKPGVVLAGRVVDPQGKSILGAWITVSLHELNPGLRLETKTDSAGKFELRAIPYVAESTVVASANGFGGKETKVRTHDAVDNRLNLGDLILPLANLSVSGIVVDAQGRPVTRAGVSAAVDGAWYSDRETQTDAEGKFTIDGLWAGRIEVSARKAGTPELRGVAAAEAGAKDIKIVVSEWPSPRQYVPKE